MIEMNTLDCNYYKPVCFFWIGGMNRNKDLFEISKGIEQLQLTLDEDKEIYVFKW